MRFLTTPLSHVSHEQNRPAATEARPAQAKILRKSPTKTEARSRASDPLLWLLAEPLHSTTAAYDLAALPLDVEALFSDSSMVERAAVNR